LDNLSTWSFKPGRIRTSSSGCKRDSHGFLSVQPFGPSSDLVTETSPAHFSSCVYILDFFYLLGMNNILSRMICGLTCKADQECRSLEHRCCGNTCLYEIDFVNLRRRFRLGRPSCLGPVKTASSTLWRSIGDAWGNALRCSVFSRPPGQNWRIWSCNIVNLVLVGLSLTGGCYGLLLEHLREI
jgi:hypothetical protein